MICSPFLRQFDAPDVFFRGAPACTWNCMDTSCPFSPSIWRSWHFLSWIPCLHLKLHGASLVLFFRQFGAPDVFPGAPACTWNCIAPLSSFSPSIWRPWRFLPWSPCLHLKLQGVSLVLFSVNLAPLTFSSLEPLLALETAGRPSRPFLRQFGAPDVFFPGAPTCTWNCKATLSSFSPSTWRPWRFLPWSPYLHLKLHGAPLETARRISRPFLRQFGAPDVFFPGATACTWNCMAPLSSFSPSIWRPWRFLPWSPCLHLKLQGTHLILFSVNLAPLTFSSLEPLLALETAWRPSCPFLRQFGAPDVFFPGAPACTWNCMAPLSSYWFNFLSSFFLSCSLFLPFFFLITFFSSFFPLFSLFSPLSFFSFPFFFLFGAPLVTPGGPGPQSPPQDTPLRYSSL